MRLRTLLLCLLALAVLPAGAAAQGRAGLRAQLGRAMAQAGAGSGAYAVDLTTGRALYATRADVARPPASVEKLYTTSTALLRFGPSATLDTRVLALGSVDAGGVLRGNLYLRGGGDPSLRSARLGSLAAQVAGQGIVSVHGAVVGDETFLDGLRGSYDSGFALDRDIGTLSGLAIDGGFSGRYLQASPATTAALRLAAALRHAGVKVSGRSRSGVTPARAAMLASLSSPPMAQLVAMTNTPSDNFFAETLLKDVGARFGGAGSTLAGLAVVRAQAGALGVHPTVVDGSGLSRADRTSPRQVVRLLGAMSRTAAGPVLRASLSIPGVTGTLRHRMRGTPAAGRCAAKTGTLFGVSALAGYCPTVDGHTVAFAFLMTGLYVTTAHRLQDRMAVALTRASVAGP